MQASLIASQVGNLFASKEDRNPLLTYDELKNTNSKGGKMWGNHDQDFAVDSFDFMQKKPLKQFKS